MTSFHKSTSYYVELDAFESDRVMHEGLVAGSRLLTEALRTGHGPLRFVWSGSSFVGTEYPSRMLELTREREAYIDTLRVSRDPCGCCGARGDIDCGCRAL